MYAFSVTTEIDAQVAMLGIGAMMIATAVIMKLKNKCLLKSYICMLLAHMIVNSFGR